MGDISKNFNKSEFACKDKCGFDDIKPNLVKLIQTIRDYINVGIIIESGCRCKKKNTAVGGVSNSAHLRGEASDIYTTKHSARELIVIIKKMYDEGLLPELQYSYCPGKGKPGTRTVHVGVDIVSKEKRPRVFNMPV
jgi:zinc D-Ala-D-Ala carboxypeptidase